MGHYLQFRDAGIVPERFQYGIPQQCGISFALSCQLDNPLGDQCGRRMGPIVHTHHPQRVLKCRSEGSNILWAESPILE